MIKNTLEQKLSQRFSPSQIQLMNMLAMPVVAFEEYLSNEIESNPALDADYSADPSEAEREPSADDTESSPAEEDASSPDDRDDFDISDYMYEDENPDYVPSSQRDEEDGDRNSFIAAQGAQNSFTEHLLGQLRMEPLTEKQMTIGRYIIGNIDSDGYLRRDLQSISDDLAFTASVDASEEEIRKVLEIIQTFDPPGVGALSLQQCLLLQLQEESDNPSTALARRVLTDFFDELSKKNYDRILERTGCSSEELSRAVSEIAHLNPKPGGNYSQGISEVQSLGVTPDFVIRIEDDQIEVGLSGMENIPQLKVSRQYSDMLRELGKVKKPSRSQQETVSFVRSKIDSARWFIDAVNQRRSTLLRIIRAIAKRQEKYLLSGDVADMVPLGLKDIAADVSMDISTVSRVASQKYADTPYGVMRLKDFFSEGSVNREGEDISTREIKQSLATVIGSEDKKAPLTDEQLTAILTDKGYNIARRTVAKYREALGFPTARLRREI